MRLRSTLILCAVLGLLTPAAALAQETVGANGQAVDGHGAAGNQTNRLVPDGPGYNFRTMSAPQNRSQYRTNDVTAECRNGSMDPSWCLQHGYPAGAHRY